MATNISIEKKQAVDTVKGDATIMVSCAITARKVHKDDAGTWLYAPDAAADYPTSGIDLHGIDPGQREEVLTEAAKVVSEAVDKQFGLYVELPSVDDIAIVAETLGQRPYTLVTHNQMGQINRFIAVNRKVSNPPDEQYTFQQVLEALSEAEAIFTVSAATK